jgi:hypothetical protein
MTDKLVLTVAVLALFATGIFAQSTAFGIKGGMTLSNQTWGGFQRDPLFKYHGIVFIESAEETDQFSVFAQAGYHLKGSAIRNRNFYNPLNGQYTRPPAQQFIFRNISLALGAKRKFPLGANSNVYYLFGIRGDYTLSTNLGEYAEINQYSGFFPFEEFVRKWNYGAIAGGGFEFPFGDLAGAILEFTVNPDFSLQYKQPEIPNIIDPYTGSNRTLGERTIRNLTFEVTLGIRLLRIVEYID